MRNLSYQLYAELPPSVCLHLEGPSRASASRTDEMIGCFTVQSKKNTEVRSLSPDANTSKIFTEGHFLPTQGVRTRAEWFQRAHWQSCALWMKIVQSNLMKLSLQLQHRNPIPRLSHPKDSEWLWHPKGVALYKQVLQNSEGSSAAVEAAVGALQNITSGEGRVGSQ